MGSALQGDSDYLGEDLAHNELVHILLSSSKCSINGGFQYCYGY